MPKQIYGDASGKSGVHAYDMGDDWIEVTFRDGSTYRYTNGSAGKSSIAYMKRLAQNGHGLNGYINLVVKKRYASKS